ncbi:metallo-beta-lactamase family protein [Syncephalastrum racemosum]|uniref:Metallo-beta-lactamase family protein n=1 Tax=Syncephalastrum racemosum TaxID=13706 RepID=A0A1X2H468_SYNRA|nr:metallo-beta-lactamase family protein [Syncephalastrum racemosum]
MATLIDVVFIGTGTSGAVPNVACLTDPKQTCQVCISSMTEAGRKNRKRNTAAVVRFRKHDDPPGARLRNVLIDCGKTFYESALDIFPKYGIRYIDGVILTHGHADACYGLDALRMWTLGGAVQPSINIYLHPETMDTVQTTFPFLVDANAATGGGDVATFAYKLIGRDTPFTIEGLEFMPLPVHHGKYISTGEPYWCYGFKMGPLAYISDTNYIPPTTMDRISDGTTDVFVVDCLRVGETHASHFALKDAIQAAKETKAQKTYLVGTTHRVDHYKLTEELKEMEKTDGLRIAPAFDGLHITFDPDRKFITEESLVDPPQTIHFT